MRADELMRKMWDDEAVGITDQTKPLTAEETFAARKVAELRCYVNERNPVALVADLTEMYSQVIMAKQDRR
ncbi:hypothetical protein ACROYT_G043813 [Oculina patagonica]